MANKSHKKIICPECGCGNVFMSKTFYVDKIWHLDIDNTTGFYDYDDGDYCEVQPPLPLQFECEKCGHYWQLDGDADDYLGEG